MNLDERLEALAQSLEILNGLQHANERRFEESVKQFTQITHNFEIVLDSIKRLERIAVRHEERLNDLDKR